MKPAYFHGHPGAASEVHLAGFSPADFGPANTNTTHVIGFSIGGLGALQFTAENPNVERLDLIACPAPLGPVIPAMAGKPVFTAARKGLLSALTATQATMLRFTPDLFLKTLFASAPTSDQALLTGQSKVILRRTYRTAFLESRSLYLSRVTAFADENTHWPFNKITCAVNIWQGRGDTWVPPAMAETLADRMPQATVHRLPSLGHYGTLIHALKEIRHT